MKKQYLLCLFLSISISLIAQTDQPSVGPNYSLQTFYNLNDGSTVPQDPTTWEIAFAVEEDGVGVFVNEAVAASFSAPLPEVELYLTASADFANADTTGMIRILNNEISWSEGAFNHVKNELDPLDMGWGTYNGSTQEVNGTRIFAIKLRNGVFKKLLIESLINGVFTFKYADLNGNNENTKTVSKSDFENKTLAYFSMETGQSLDFEPEKWDLLFNRYYATIDDGGGGTTEYMVTGVLSNQGVQIAQADEIDPISVDYQDYEDSYTDSINAIGHDWKYFDLGAFEWVVPLDRVYFIKSQEDELWKVLFSAFGGSSTGVTTIEKQFEVSLAVLEQTEHLQSFEVFPNPAEDYVNIAFELDVSLKNGLIQITDAMGRIVKSYNVEAQQGLNVKTISLDIPAGIYQLSFSVENDFISKTIMVK